MNALKGLNSAAASATAQVVNSLAAGTESSGVPGVRSGAGSLNWRSASELVLIHLGPFAGPLFLGVGRSSSTAVRNLASNTWSRTQFQTPFLHLVFSFVFPPKFVFSLKIQSGQISGKKATRLGSWSRRSPHLPAQLLQLL